MLLKWYMKKINFLIIAVLCCSLHVTGQQNPTSEVANMTLPKEVTKLSKDQTLEFVHRNFKHHQSFRNYNNMYNSGGINY